MGPLAQFLLALTNLVRSGIIRNIPTALKAAEREFGKVTPLLKKQIERIFEQAKKPKVGEPGKKEGAVLPFVKKTEGIETLDEFNLSKDDPMGDLEKIVKGEGDTGLPSQFTDKEVDAAIDNVSPGFSGDMKTDSELVANNLSQKKFGKEFFDLDPKQQVEIYGRVFDRLSRTKMQKEVTKTDELMDFFQKEIDKAEKPSGKFEGLESTDNIRMGIENLKNPRRPGGPLDPVQGITRTITRRILDRKGIKINKGEDPIDVFINNFGVEVGTDVQKLADDIVEAEQMGRNLKPLDDLIEIEGLFDVKINPDANPGITNEELIERLEKDLKEKEILEDFDPTDRDPNAKGGLTRTSYAMGKGPVLPSDEDPINPFQPKPTGPVLPDKSMMASDDANERLLEQLFEEFLDLGFPPEIAAEKAREEFYKRDFDAKAKQAPSIKLAEADYDNIMKLEDEAMQRALDAFQYYRSMGGKLNFRDYLREAGDKGEQFRGAEGGLAGIINL